MFGGIDMKDATPRCSSFKLDGNCGLLMIDGTGRDQVLVDLNLGYGNNLHLDEALLGSDWIGLVWLFVDWSWLVLLLTSRRGPWACPRLPS